MMQRQKVGVSRLAQAGSVSSAIIYELRRRAPERREPDFSLRELSSIFEKGEGWFEYRLKNGKAPDPKTEQRGRGVPLIYSLQAVQEWCKKERHEYFRPAGALGLVLCVGNFKGGSAKTTTAVTLAQGLALRGHKVLVIDADSPSNASSLFGVLSDYDKVQTLLPVFTDGVKDIRKLVMPTHWSGIDLIAANRALSHANSVLPTKKEYWYMLREAIKEAKKDYDVIVIDTSPALDPLTVNCLLASDALIMPVTPNPLDYLSSAQYWSIFSDMLTGLPGGVVMPEYEFVRIFLSRVDGADRENVAMMREVMQASYSELLMSVEIPKSTYMTGATAQFGTVYESPAYKMQRRALIAARAPYEAFVSSIEREICAVWAQTKN